jgi:transcriptional repressor NrdR
MDQAVERVSRWVADHYDHEVSSQIIGERVMLEMARLDDVAYVRFASVYRQFKDINEFMRELEAAKNREGDGEEAPFRLTPPPVEI